MTDQEKIDLLGEALNNLMQSADNYIVDGSWLNDMVYDIERAKGLINRLKIKQYRLLIYLFNKNNLIKKIYYGRTKTYWE